MFCKCVSHISIKNVLIKTLILYYRKRFDAQNYARKLADGDLDEDDFKDIRMEVTDEVYL